MAKLKLETRAKRAFNKLKEMGAPVMHFGEGWGGRALFAISGEANDDEIWADYYRYNSDKYPFGVNPKVEKVLSQYGLYCEWCNPGVLDVFNA